MLKKIYNNNLLRKNKYDVNKDLNTTFLNKFFDINDDTDRLFFVYYDVFNWDQKSRWILFRPYQYSYYFTLKELLKWRYVRLINKTNKKKKFLIKNKFNAKSKNSIWLNWNIKNKKRLEFQIIPFYLFKFEVKDFKFKQFYFFFRNKPFFNLNYGVKNKQLKNKNKNLNFYYYILIYFNWKFKFKFFKKSNKKFLFFNIFFKSVLYSYLYIKFTFISLPLALNGTLFKSLLFVKINKIISIFSLTLIKEKQKLKKFLLDFDFITYFLRLRELKRRKGYISTARVRRKKIDIQNDLRVKRKFYKYRAKRRTKKQLWKIQIKKYKLQVQLHNRLINNVYKLILNQPILNFYNMVYFTNLKHTDIYEDFFYWRDFLYAYYLPFTSNKRGLYFMNNLATDDSSNLWKGTFKKKNISDYKNVNFKFTFLLNNSIGDIKQYNKVNIQNIYKYLINSNNSVSFQEKPKKYFLLQNVLTLIRFYKNNLFGIKNLDFIFNLYFWLTIFFNWLSKSKILNIKKILNFTSFLNMLELIYINKFNWFTLNMFDIYINILTYNNMIVKLKCTFEFLLQEVCIYLYFLLFKLKLSNFYEQNNIKKKIKNMKLLKNMQYGFKGTLNFENNYILCLDLIKKIVGNSYFLNIIANYFQNCKLSLKFIKRNIKLYWILLELSYTAVDTYSLNVFNKFNLINDIFYLRYKNVILFFINSNMNFILDYVLKNFILYFLYFCLYFYFFFFVNINLKVQNLLFFGYSICLDLYKNDIVIKIDNLEIFKLLITYSFLQIKDKKLIIKVAHNLLSYPVLRILNYFCNIWFELISYYSNFDFGLLIKYQKFFFKSCFLTIVCKLKKKQKLINLVFFKKIFNLNFNWNNKIIEKKLKKYIIKNNKVQLKSVFNKKKLK